jgi:uncharacterized protein (DUF2252 family)
MSDLIAIVKATRSSASALQTIARVSRQIREAERCGDTAQAAMLYPALSRAQRRYDRAQAILAANPLPGDCR